MTIESKISKNVYQGNGQTTIFPFTFKIWKNEEILVTVEDDKGITSNITPYDVILGDNGGEVVLYIDNENKTPVPSGYSIALTRNMPFLQEQDYINSSRFNAEVIEDNFDVATVERQELLEKLERAVIMSPTDTRSPEQVLQDFISKYNEINIKYPEIIHAFNVIYPRIEEVLQQCIVNKDLAYAWAESDTPPDPDDPESKSAKDWAMIAGDVIPIATGTLLGKVKLGETITGKEDGTIDVAEAVLNDIDNNTGNITYLQNTKLDKSAVSSALDSESHETAGSSYALKTINDKMGKVQLIEEINSNSTIPQVLTLTDVIPYKPIFIAVSNTENNYGAHIEFHAKSGTFNDIINNNSPLDGRFRIATRLGSEDTTTYKTSPSAVFIPHKETVEILISRLNSSSSPPMKTTVKFFQ